MNQTCQNFFSEFWDNALKYISYRRLNFKSGAWCPHQMLPWDTINYWGFIWIHKNLINSDWNDVLTKNTNILLKFNEIFSKNIPNICLLCQFVYWSAIWDFWNFTCQSTPKYELQWIEMFFFWRIPKIRTFFLGGNCLKPESRKVSKNFTSYCE